MDMFSGLMVIVHVVVSFFLIVVVLLQTGKGAEMGAVLGGAGSQTLFGGSGGGNFLSKLTVWAAVIFMLTSLGLTAAGRSGGSSIMERMAPPPAQMEPSDAFPGAGTMPSLESDVVIDEEPAPAEGDPQ